MSYWILYEGDKQIQTFTDEFTAVQTAISMDRKERMFYRGDKVYHIKPSEKPEDNS